MALIDRSNDPGWRGKSGRWRVHYRDAQGRQRTRSFNRKSDARTYDAERRAEADARREARREARRIEGEAAA